MQYLILHSIVLLLGNRFFLKMNNKQKNWYSIAIKAPPEAEEAVEFALNELDSLGNEISDFGKPHTEFTTVIGYFNEKIDERVLREKLERCLNIYGFSIDAVKISEWREIENQDWIAEWKKHWKSTETEKFIIAPPWEKIENAEKIIIRIEPQMAFGTGTHETTRLCLRAIEENYLPEMSFFDLGTGTGILAVAAAKLKVPSSKFQVPSLKPQLRKTEDENTFSDFKKKKTWNLELGTWNSISACDTDEEAVKIAAENAHLNDENDIDFFVGSISAETPNFDFVCANVTADVIVPLLPLLIEKTRQILVLSGILVEQENLVTEKLNSLGIENFTIKTDGEWIGIIVEISDLKSQEN